MQVCESGGLASDLASARCHGGLYSIRICIAASSYWARSRCPTSPQLRSRPAAMCGRSHPSTPWLFVYDYSGCAHEPVPRRGFLPAAGPVNDIFGHWPMVWHLGERAAWDVFGFRIWLCSRTPTPRPPVEVLLADNRLWRAPGWSLISGKGTRMHVARTGAHICVQTSPRFQKLCRLGRDYVVSVRSVRHWVSRWRRGLRGLRRSRAQWLFEHKMPDSPEVVALVVEFL